ncbi:MAG: hypothetical protein RL535_193 [Pseudomonadota bacterium]
MRYIHKVQTALFSLACVGLSACNPVPLSVVASDFSINGVAGVSTNTSTNTSTSTGTGTNTTTSSASTISATTSATTTSKTTGATTSTATPTANTNTVQNVTIDLTFTEACTTFSSLVAKVQLDEGVKISPDPSEPRDYSNPVTYTVTELYGLKVVYSVTVKGTVCPVVKVPAVVPSTTAASV